MYQGPGSKGIARSPLAIDVPATENGRILTRQSPWTSGTTSRSETGTERSGQTDLPYDDLEQFYAETLREAVKSGSAQFYGQVLNERDWERKRKPYYNLWPSIVPMLTRLNLDLDSSLIRLPLPALCVRLPKDPAKNPLKFDWKGEEIPIRCMLVGEINDGKGLSILIDIGEVMGDMNFPLYTYRNFRRQDGLTVEAALKELRRGWTADMGIQMPESSDRRLRAALLHLVPAGERPRGDFARCPGR